MKFFLLVCILLIYHVNVLKFEQNVIKTNLSCSWDAVCSDFSNTTAPESDLPLLFYKSLNTNRLGSALKGPGTFRTFAFFFEKSKGNVFITTNRFYGKIGNILWSRLVVHFFLHNICLYPSV